jgi:putative transposase
MSPRRPYSTDLSDDEWKILESLVPNAKPGGRPRAHETRELLNAIFYVLRGGCAWRLLPHDFLPWQTAYQLLQGLAHGRHLGEDTHRPAKEATPPGG